ncbi:hypothetical protein [Actinosynnema sp. NPDC023587]|uniref:hypothetical protein n=1 Tax=Actinosynnema sp. NPDC023587 TaxID=3154695 RepID=UPI00340B5CF4
MPPKRTTAHLPLAALLLAVSVLTVGGESLPWVRGALLSLAGAAIVVWAVGYRRLRLRRAAEADAPGTTPDAAPETTASGTALNG